MKNLTLSQIVGGILVTLGVGYILLQVLIWAIDSSTYL